MGNDVAIYDRVQDPAQFLAAMGRHITRSRMFGCETEDQGVVLALECAARRIPPLALSQKYHLIKGKLSMKADAMLGGLINVGGKYDVVSHTSDLAAIEITRDRKKQKFSLSWEEAQAEPFSYLGKEADILKQLASGSKPTLKPKYATPRSRMQMLWARVVSDGVRVMAPDVVAGTYTPEEQEDIVDTTARVVHTDGPTLAEVAKQQPAEQPAKEPIEQAAVDAEQAEIDANMKKAEAGVAAADAETKRLVDTQPEEHRPAAGPSVVSAITDDQIIELDKLVRALGVEEKLPEILAKADRPTVRDLSKDQAGRLIKKLKEAWLNRTGEECGVPF